MLIRLISPSATASEKITDALAVNAAFTLAFAAFLCIGEFTYPAPALVNRHRLQQEYLTIPRVSLATDHLLLVIPKSKTDKFNQGITIRVARVGDAACASGHMEKWLAARPASKWPPLQTPLFEFADGTPFAKEKLVDILHQRLVNIGEPPTRFAGHSFRRGAAQHALESGLSEDEIQELGRWKSDAVKRYYKRTPQAIIDLNQRFQTGKPVPATGPAAQ
jgi:integrase